LNPRFARYHQIVSARQRWDAAAVQEALDLLATPVGQPESESGDAADDAPS
jgi:hypothetical protein